MTTSLDRRNALTLMMLAAGATVFRPVWAQDWTPALLANIAGSLAEGDKLLVAAVADTLIPSDGKIGALSAGVDNYVAAYIADCLTAQEQSGIQLGLLRLDQLANSTYGRSFVRCKQSEREQMLTALKNSQDANERQFFRFMHTRSIQGFTSSEQVLVNYHHYSMTHDHYDGDVTIAP